MPWIPAGGRAGSLCVLYGLKSREPPRESLRPRGSQRSHISRVVSYGGCAAGKVTHSVRDHTWSARPAARTTLEIRHQPPHIRRGAFAGHHTQDQPMLRIVRHVIPVVAPPLIGGLLVPAMALFLGDEGPLLVALDLAGTGGKRSPVPRATAGHGSRRPGCNG
jgi:hypothetical protein